MGPSEQQAGSEEAHISGVFEPYCGLYPGIASFTAEYDAADYREWVSRSNGDPVPAPLMLVVEDGVQTDPADAAHQPAWHTVITREIQLQGALFDGDRPLESIVCAPGISTGWSNDALYELSSSIQNAFSVAPTAFARWCACFGQTHPSAARLKLLRVLGFSKARLGMDLSLSNQGGGEVSAEFERVESLLVEARKLGYRSLAVDLILPAVLTSTLADRVEAFLAQTRTEYIRLIVVDGQQGTLPDSSLMAFRSTILSGLGYRHLGLDWYVAGAEPSPDAPLHWSPLGFTHIEGLDIIGAGPGAISVLEDASSQNTVQRERYQDQVERGEIPMERGVELESDDVLRRTVMSGLLTDECFDIGALEDRWGILFPKYFETEMVLLRELEQRGKLLLTEREIRTLERDRHSLTAVCRIFDNQDRIARVLPLREAR